MSRKDVLFFSKTYDFLHVYIPKEKGGSKHTFTTYKQGLKTFRNYVNNVAALPSNKFEFKDCTYDFLLDYRNYLHDVMDLKKRTVNNKLAAVKSYVGYASARDVSLQQYAFSIGQVPYYSEPKERQPVIEDEDALAVLLSKPANTRKGLRDTVIMCILYDSGMRVAELVSLNVRDVCVDYDNVKIRVHGKGNKERCLFVDSKTSALIRQYMKEFHPERNADVPFVYTVIGGTVKHMTVRNVQKLIKKYADKVRESYELPSSVSPHTLRNPNLNKIQTFHRKAYKY
ncbi:MAG: tyrosine-type recombinase/integrase, partial [Eubacteriales bacterium]|nr:tyrosine-type recombinase/integrase [Eubacteriales bacterium]